MALRRFRDQSPRIHPSCFIEESAQVIGDVELGEDSSVWFNSVLRGDVNGIRIGQRTNIQDLTMIHVTGQTETVIGDDVTVGHRVILHGCRVGHRVLVGMGAIVMDDVEIGEDCIIGAGTLLTPGTKIPPGSLVVGSPGKVKRPLTPEERTFLLESARHYVETAGEHRASR
ncbi:gamma carbonic anhydrase family protein [Cystobacter fuscus]|uniref:Gamma carbonic anhydrase family protein n=2 Tax=Cystobacter TaxID=42 RepID=A0A1L9BHX5_9BACT|nr:MULTISPECIES: gamma carbonic anhydrase family protein [Cystobacter]ATB39621.1 gamma carbonic anhydrase family protein [Cystobacter fuscus]OJH41825.1 gamma carbonic anhydrase family protein [Cystobacter ferrugineus]WNG27019.1 gamma carbonic anhydrase family protein [Cystobacter fuscus]